MECCVSVILHLINGEVICEWYQFASDGLDYIITINYLQAISWKLPEFHHHRRCDSEGIPPYNWRSESSNIPGYSVPQK